MQQIKKMRQASLFETPGRFANKCRFIPVYRLSLVKDTQVSFNGETLSNAKAAQAFFRRVIETQGQPDREQFVQAMLNSKNGVIGVNIVSIGCLTSATVHPREVFKPAILANAAALIFCHNHPSGDCTPSTEDIAVTEKLVAAAEIMGITVHEHLVISMYDDRFYSFSEKGLIQQMYLKARIQP